MNVDIWWPARHWSRHVHHHHRVASQIQYPCELPKIEQTFRSDYFEGGRRVQEDFPKEIFPNRSLREAATMRVLLPLLLLPMASVSASCFGRDAHFKKAKAPVVVQPNRADPTKVWWFSTICFLVTIFLFSDPGFLGASNWKTTMCWQVDWLNTTHITTGSGASNH